ncbi:bacteriochlorophyll 4-vinyl reductase [Heliomicrobium modesticaldum Ice1]|uniref:Bacteriochlorophyll 4-vinyl reductase n=1 Tax=Heliobacterium modesticaldum (strain ATCC 51547 / Ice1) TaxID=498761 RepID=B0TBM0_HELMI|nr:bacteriochlorophyll 4-vinyl reductase [Heliomicrobium modesticaldum]ABZ83859.1 bacteriochlorophyll 4-vinyl reductase [Heliomicrobium modesticaldum Ice1]
MDDIATHTYGKIGPNSIIQTVAALQERYGEGRTAEFLVNVGRGDLTQKLPAEMVDEQEFNDLVRSIQASFGNQELTQLLRRSGELTAAYLLKHRIPLPIQWILRILPVRAGLKMLLSAIEKNAWTFVGTGSYRFTMGDRPRITIERCLSCRGLSANEPICAFYEGTFQTLIRTLVDKEATVKETACSAKGAPACVYEIRLDVS